MTAVPGNPGADDGLGLSSEAPAATAADSPYTSPRRPAIAPDLDAGAPQLKARELRRLNQRALVLLAVVVALLLLVAYWMLSSAGQRKPPSTPREEKVIVADAPAPLLVPRLTQVPPVRPPQAIPLAPTPPLLPTPVRSSRLPDTEAARATSPAQRRITARSDTPGSGATTDSVRTTGAADLPDNQTPDGQQARPTSARLLLHTDTLMQRGTYIRCVLETRIMSDIPGFASCLVTERVYALDGQRLLLPKGSKILGTYEGSSVGDRVAVVWDRIITPTGIDVDMASPGIDNLGGAGLPGHYDAHWRRRIGSALLISLLSDAFKYEAAEHGPRSTTISNGVVTQQPFQSNTAQTVQSLASQAVREAANRPPTVTINQGTIVYVYVARDVDFSGVVARY